MLPTGSQDQWIALTELPDCKEGQCGLGVCDNGHTVILCHQADCASETNDFLPWRAYLNRCPHQSIPLADTHNHDQLFHPKHRLLICTHHFAMFDPVSGACVGGPCVGQCLRPLPLRSARGKVWVSLPHSELMSDYLA